MTFGGTVKFKISREVFSDAVQWTSRSVQQRPSIPILTAVRISASDDGEVEFSSFDYEVSARSRVEAKVITSGEALVSGRMVTEIAKSLPNQEVTVTLGDSHVEIECGRAKFVLGTMPLEDYPDLPGLPESKGAIGGAELARALQQVVIATSKDETLPLLTGVKVEIAGGKITLLATDRYRLAMRELQWDPIEPDFETNLLVKARVLTDVGRNLGGGAPVEFRLSETSSGERTGIIAFSAGPRETTSSLMDGDYPPVRKLFPENTPHDYVCNRIELLEAVKRVSLVVERKTPVRLTFEDGSLTLEAGQGDTAQARESIALVTGSERLQTAFNPGFLQDGLSALDSEFVRFGFTDATKAAVLLGQEKEDGDADHKFKYLLMPIRFGA